MTTKRDLTREDALEANIYVHGFLANSGEYQRSPHFRPENREKVRRILERLTANIPTGGNAKLIDFGCGTGFIIDLAKDLFDAPQRVEGAASKSEAIARATKAICLIEAVQGDGLLIAPRDFGSGFSPKRVASDVFERARRGCAAGDAEACLEVAGWLFSECGADARPGCNDARFARTLLTHACGIGREAACDGLRAKPAE